MQKWFRAQNAGNVHNYKNLAINPMVYPKLKLDELFWRYLHKQAVRNNGDPMFDKEVAKILHIKLFDRAASWLDDHFKGTDRIALEALLTSHLDKPMSEDEFKIFSSKVKTLGLSAFGRETCDRKDRDDQPWGMVKFNNKMQTWAFPYIVRTSGASFTLMNNNKK